ncbi:MAG: hypothetical protein R3F13_13805 [Prosthecobacter sp.]
MKLRLRGQSLRLRLTKSEVAALNARGFWQDETVFGAGGFPALTYRVESSLVEHPEVRLTADHSAMVMVVLPSADVNNWAETAKVGLYFEAPWGLKVAVEKDFQCLDPRRDEDESDNFDNPNAGTGGHAGCGVNL